MRCMLLFTVGLTAILASADVSRAQQPEVKKENLQCSGTVKQIGRGGLQLVTEEGEQWLVQSEARPQDIAFTGSADASFVKAGMWVRFSGKFNSRGKALESVAALTVFTPREGEEVGVVNEAAAAGGAGGAADKLFSDDKPEPDAKPKSKSLAADATYRVAGQIAKLSRGGEMTIQARGTQVKANLADNAKVSIDVGDLALVRVGDKATIRGWYVAGQKGRAWASQIEVSAKEPLSDAAKKKRPPASEKPTAEKPATEKPAEVEKTPVPEAR